MKMTRTVTVLLLGLWLTTAIARDIPVEEGINAELDYLLGFVGTGRQPPASIRVERVGKTLEFLAGPKEGRALYYANDRNGASSAYLEVDLRRPIADVLRLTYDTDVPAVVTSPSTVRTARWTHLDAGDGRLPRFWERVVNPGTPVAVSGIEHLVNSPDAHTGAYYEYDLDRSLVLVNWRDRPLFISLSAQKGPSAVGKQGIILGTDDHWTYLYSGIPGLNWPGFGWVDSYLYDSYSVAFILGMPDGKPPTRFGIFKWIKAGWIGLNMVKRSHIADGLRRYGDALKLILENPSTADAAAIVRQFTSIRNIPRHQLEKLTESYLDTIRASMLASSTPRGAKEALALLSKGGYLRSLGHDDMIAIASVEGLKVLLGKPHYLKPPAWPAVRTSRPAR